MQERAPSTAKFDDAVLPFQVDALDVRGRMVRLGPLIDAILTRHAYPEPVARLLAEASALAVLIGSALKFDGRLTLQTKSDGPVDLLVVDVATPDKLRAYARFDEARLAEFVAAGTTSPAALMGRGHLAMTIDQGAHMERYQGLVALDGSGLEEAAHQYFERSEQIPTRVRLAVAEEVGRDDNGQPRHLWRAGGLMVQFLPSNSERRRSDWHPGDAPEGAAVQAPAEDDAWVEARSLVATVEDVELIDPSLSGEQLLWRLFNETGVRVFDPMPLAAHCTCNRERLKNVIARFTAEERRHMLDEGRIVATCEFCSTSYVFMAEEVEG